MLIALLALAFVGWGGIANPGTPRTGPVTLTASPTVTKTAISERPSNVTEGTQKNLAVTELLEPWGGFVIDALGRPIAGATVTHLRGDQPRSDTPSLPSSARSDDNGRFVLILDKGIAPQVYIEAEGYFQIQVLLSSNDITTYNLFRGGVLEGRVLGHQFYLTTEQQPAPTPIVGAVIEVAASAGWSITVTTDELGKYKVTTPPGKLVVSARSDNHGDARFDHLEVGRDEVLSRDLILPAGVMLDAFIMSSTIPLIDARVRVYNDAQDHADERSGAGGKTRLVGLAAGIAAVHVVHPGYQEQSFNIIIPSDRIGVRKPFLILESEPFKVSVTDHQGRPLADARIRIKRDRKLITETTASDVAALSVLASGQTYTIEVRPPNGNPGTGITLPPRTFSYKMPTEGPGELKVILRPGGRITGVVLAPNGYPVAGAMVLIQAIGVEPGLTPSPRLVKTSPDGLFRSQPFSAGSWTVSISHPQVGTMQLETTVIEGKDRSLGELIFPVR
ncbi:MAG: carboxypeptidase-like regulatory domain-containing protein [Planctomycetota bacterium]|nr:carboxypeptidase-like regulatory domain-containing protein [Planctomycetota bacterium]